MVTVCFSEEQKPFTQKSKIILNKKLDSSACSKDITENLMNTWDILPHLFEMSVIVGTACSSLSTG